MLLVTAISFLTGPNILTVLLEYTNFQSQSRWQYKANIREKLPIYPWHGLTLYYKPK